MGTTNPLPPGRAFEEEVFGVTEENIEFAVRYPRRIGIHASLQRVIQDNWTMYAEAVEKNSAYCHDPINPQMGKTHLLWVAVKDNLPRRINGHSALPLNLYIAVGRNSLDWRHGIDAFFWWQGVYVTIDVSLRPKSEEELKADFLVMPEDLEPEQLQNLGKKIAELLKERNFGLRRHEKKHNLHHAPNVEELE
jgi:hypothetical protein